MNDDEIHYDEDGNEYRLFTPHDEREKLSVMYEQLQIVGAEAGTPYTLNVSYGWLFHAAQCLVVAASYCIEKFQEAEFDNEQDEEEARKFVDNTIMMYNRLMETIRTVIADEMASKIQNFN